MKGQPNRGDIWTLSLDPTLGHEQAGYRPCLVFSRDEFNHGPADLAVILPITGTDRKLPLHILLQPEEGGLKKKSFIMCENIRSVSKQRLKKKIGSVSADTLKKVEECLKILLSL